MRNQAIRRQNRRTKAMRRLREDVAEHGSWTDCHCFEAKRRQAGKVFSQFADNPKLCSNPGCCGNPRHGWGTEKFRLTHQERKAPTIKDWD